RSVIRTGTGPSVQAEKMSGYGQSKTYTAEGNVVIQDNAAILHADHVRGDNETQEFWADGNVRVNQGAQEWVAPAAYYDFGKPLLKADVARGFVDPLYLSLEHLVQTATNHYTFATATMTTCDQQHPDYHLQAKRGEVFMGDRLILRDVTLRFGDTP